jgi:hypothetical protein
MPDYSNSYVYKITSSYTPYEYIGSSTSKKRLYEHQYDMYRWLEKDHTYTTSYEIVCFDDAKLTVLERVDCTGLTDDQASIKLRNCEQTWLDKADNLVNARKTINDKNEIIRNMEICECGMVINKKCIIRHRKSARHLRLLNNINI